MKNMTKSWKPQLGAGLAMALLAGGVYAGAIDPYLTDGLNILEDDSNEYVFRYNAVTSEFDLVTSGAIAEGDYLVQIFDFGIVNGVNVDSDGVELTALGVSMITDISSAGTIDPDGPGPRPSYDAVNFSLTTASSYVWTELTGYDAPSIFGGNVIAAIFQDYSNDLDVYTQVLTAAAANATNGDLFMALGLVDADDYVYASNVPLNVEDFNAPGNTPGVSTFGNFAYGLSVLAEGIDGEVLSDVTGSGTNLTTDRIDIAGIIDDTQFSFVADVPEPGTLAALGLGMLGLGLGGLVRRRREVE